MSNVCIASLVLAALMLSGCRGSGERVESPEGAVGELRAATAAIGATAAYPAEAAEAAARRYSIAGGKDDGKVMVVDRRADGGATIESWTIEGETRPRFERLLRREADGSVVMLEQRSVDRNVRSVFDPPLAVFPAELSVEGSFTMSSRMTVHPLDKPKAIKERGMARVEITMRGMQALRGGAGDAVVVRTVFTADLKSADVVRTTDRWFVPGEGLAREHYEESVKVLGVMVERTSETFASE
jgi:hypothetical protein